MSVPKFSIIVPVYNAEKYIGMALDSVLAQTYSDWECICVDDGSKDSSGSILDEYATKDSRIKVIHQSNAGEGPARNTGLEVASGEWVTCLDADDLYAPDRLAEMLRLIVKENPSLVRFGVQLFCGDVKTISGGNRVEDCKVYCGDAAKIWGWKVLLPYGMACTWAVRRYLIAGLKFRAGMRVKVDSIFCCGIVSRISKVAESSNETYYYRQIPTSAINSKRCVNDVLSLLRAVEDVWNDSACEGSVLSEMRIRLRNHCESEVSDWLDSGVDITDTNLQLVDAQYRKMLSEGCFSPKSHKELLWRMAFNAYVLTRLFIWLRTAAVIYKIGRSRAIRCVRRLLKV